MMRDIAFMTVIDEILRESETFDHPYIQIDAINYDDEEDGRDYSRDDFKTALSLIADIYLNCA